MNLTLPSHIELSVPTALSLAAVHIAHFAEMIERGGRGVQRGECERYLVLWREIRAALKLGRDLDSEHLSELYDAATDASYESYLTPEEFRAIHLTRRAS